MNKEIERLAYTEGEFAEATGTPRPTVSAARKSGDLPAIKSGRRWIITREDGLAWLRRCKERGSIPAPISQSDRQRLADLNRSRKVGGGGA